MLWTIKGCFDVLIYKWSNFWEHMASIQVSVSDKSDMILGCNVLECAIVEAPALFVEVIEFINKSCVVVNDLSVLFFTEINSLDITGHVASELAVEHGKTRLYTGFVNHGRYFI